jgi:leucyl-tRNA synthetase
VKYPVQFNGKMRFLLELPKSLGREEVEAAVRVAAETEKYLQGAVIRKVIVVPGKIINIVC